MEVGFEPHSVVKVPPGSSACVFRLETFTKAIQHNLQLENYTYDTIFNMSTMCTVRVSFVKGWGTSYKRAKITQCPCWIDLTLNGPLRMLDKVLRYLHPPLASLSSGSGGKNSPDFITEDTSQGRTSCSSSHDVTCSSLGSSTSSLVAVLSSVDSKPSNCNSKTPATEENLSSASISFQEFEKRAAMNVAVSEDGQSCKESSTFLRSEKLLPPPDKCFKLASVAAANDVTMLRGAECGLIHVDDDDDDLEIMMMS